MTTARPETPTVAAAAALEDGGMRQAGKGAAAAPPGRPLRIAFLHPDLGIGGFPFLIFWLLSS